MAGRASNAGESSRERGVYVISVAAELAGVHPQTLRVYERKRLIRPQRTSGNSRLYSEKDVEVLRRIQELTQVQRVNLAGARMIMDLESRLEELEEKLEELRERTMRAEKAVREVARRRGALVRLKDVRDFFGVG